MSAIQTMLHAPAPDMLPTKAWITAAELAAGIGVSERTLYDWRQQRPTPIPFCQVGRFVRYLRADVEAWRERNTVQAA